MDMKLEEAEDKENPLTTEEHRRAGNPLETRQAEVTPSSTMSHKQKSHTSWAIKTTEFAVDRALCRVSIKREEHVRKNK